MTRAFLFKSGIVCASTLIGLGLTEILFRIVPEPLYDPGEMDAGLIQYDDRLGWRHRENWQGQHTHADFQATYSTDARGYRKDPSPNQGPATLVLGDSFTFGVGVSNRQTFVARLNQRFPDRRFINAGVIGYSTDQQVLHLEKIRRIQPIDSILLAVYLGNDISDNARAYPLQAAQAKPFFHLNDAGELELKNIPVPTEENAGHLPGAYTRELLAGVYRPSPWEKVLSHSAIWKRIDLTRKAFFGYPQLEYTDHFSYEIRLFKALLKRISGKNSQVTVLLLPGKSYVEDPRSFPAQYMEFLRNKITQLDLPPRFLLLDATEPMRLSYEANPEKLFFFPNEGHFNAAGNQWVADFIARSGI